MNIYKMNKYLISSSTDSGVHTQEIKEYVSDTLAYLICSLKYKRFKIHKEVNNRWQVVEDLSILPINALRDNKGNSK